MKSKKQNENYILKIHWPVMNRRKKKQILIDIHVIEVEISKNEKRLLKSSF